MEIPAVDPALPHKMQLKHFVKVVRREVEPVVTPVDNVKTLTLLNAIKEAAETGQLVELQRLKSGPRQTPRRAPRPATNKPLFFAPRAASCPRGILLRCRRFFWGEGLFCTSAWFVRPKTVFWDGWYPW